MVSHALKPGAGEAGGGGVYFPHVLAGEGRGRHLANGDLRRFAAAVPYASYLHGVRAREHLAHVVRDARRLLRRYVRVERYARRDG